MLCLPTYCYSPQCVIRTRGSGSSVKYIIPLRGGIPLLWWSWNFPDTTRPLQPCCPFWLKCDQLASCAVQKCGGVQHSMQDPGRWWSGPRFGSRQLVTFGRW